MLDGETDGSYSFSNEEEQELSDISDVETDDQSREFNYTFKLINLMCKTDFQTIELGKGKKLKSLSSLQQFISKKLSANPKFQTPDLKTACADGLLGTRPWFKGEKKLDSYRQQCQDDVRKVREEEIHYSLVLHKS